MENSFGKWRTELHNDSKCKEVVPDDRCCNCGMQMLPLHVHILKLSPKIEGVSPWWFVAFKSCSEGCSIQIITRGTCTTVAEHPWNLFGYDWEPNQMVRNLWPELIDIRNRIKAQREQYEV